MIDSIENLKILNNDLTIIPQWKKHNKFDNHKFVWENQKTNNFPKNASAHNLAEDYYQEIYDFFLQKNLEKDSRSDW